MDGSGTPEPAGVITSSADRMVGMEHSEVRYFTR
jgi:protein arginine N-methyltransferase 1